MYIVLLNIPLLNIYLHMYTLFYCEFYIYIYIIFTQGYCCDMMLLQSGHSTCRRQFHNVISKFTAHLDFKTNFGCSFFFFVGWRLRNIISIDNKLIS